LVWWLLMRLKYKNKFLVETTRLKHWDYSWNATYFVTICTKERINFFGDVVNGEMVLNDIGRIVKTEWYKTFEMRPDMNLEMGEFVVMPNHFHAIIGIGDNKYNSNCNMNRRDAMHCVSTEQNTINRTKNQFGPQSKNLASIIRGFKIGVTKNARLINPDFQWQTRFYEHIIRDEKGLIKIMDYIKNNPKNWKNDKFR